MKLPNKWYIIFSSKLLAGSVAEHFYQFTRDVKLLYTVEHILEGDHMHSLSYSLSIMNVNVKTITSSLLSR